jgi:hypothetical protein
MSLVPVGPTAYLSQPATLVTQPYGYSSPYYGGGYGYPAYGGSLALSYPRRRASRLGRAAEALVLGDEADRLRMLEAEMLVSSAYGGYGGYPGGYGRYYGGYGGYAGYGGYGGYGGYPYGAGYGYW